MRTQSYPIISSVEGLPHDSLSLLSCGTSLGGVIVLTTNALIYVDQSSRRVVLPVNGWAARISDLPVPPIAPTDQTRYLELEGSRCVFADDKTIFVVLKDGTVYPVEVIAEGKSVSKLVMAPALAQTTIPAVIQKLNHELIFIGSTAGPSVLMKAARVEEEIDEDHIVSPGPAVVQVNNAMDMDDDDDGMYATLSYRQTDQLMHSLDIYGTASKAEETQNGRQSPTASSRKHAPYYSSPCATPYQRMVQLQTWLFR